MANKMLIDRVDDLEKYMAELITLVGMVSAKLEEVDERVKLQVRINAQGMNKKGQKKIKK